MYNNSNLSTSSSCTVRSQLVVHMRRYHVPLNNHIISGEWTVTQQLPVESIQPQFLHSASQQCSDQQLCSGDFLNMMELLTVEFCLTVHSPEMMWLLSGT